MRVGKRKAAHSETSRKAYKIVHGGGFFGRSTPLTTVECVLDDGTDTPNRLEGFHASPVSRFFHSPTMALKILITTRADDTEEKVQASFRLRIFTDALGTWRSNPKEFMVAVIQSTMSFCINSACVLGAPKSAIGTARRRLKTGRQVSHVGQ